MKKALDKQFALSLVVLLAAVCAMGYFIFGPSRAEFHADCTDTILWAQASVESGSVVNPDFSYASILPFGGALLMQPLVALMGVSLLTHQVGMFLFTLLLCWALLFLFRSLGQSWSAAFLETAFVLLGLTASMKMREIYFNHIIYYSVGTLFFCVSFGVLSRLWHKEKKGILLAAFFLWTLLTSSNGLTGITLSVLPCAAAMVWERVSTPEPLWKERRRWYALFALLLAMGLGLWLRALVVGDTVTEYADSFSGFSAPAQWGAQLDKLLPDWFSLFGVGVADGTKTESLADTLFASPEGIAALLRMGLALLALCLPVVGLFTVKRAENESLWYLLVAHFFMAALLAFGFVVGELSGAYWRLSPLLASSLVCSAMLVAGWMKGKSLPMRRFGVILCAAFALFASERAVNLFSLPMSSATSRKMDELISVLDEHDLHYGYGNDFWKCNNITVLTGERIKVRQVSTLYDSISPAFYQTNACWYDDQPDVQDYFFIISKVDLDAQEELFLPDPIDCYEVGGNLIYVYDYNIAYSN